MATFLQVLRHKNRVSRTLLRQPEIVGVGIGYANPNKPSAGAALHIYTKRNISKLTVQNKVAKVTDTEFPMRIIPSGVFHMNKTITTPQKKRPIRASSKINAAPNYSRLRIRPVPGGTSIGHIYGNTNYAGTAGLIVIRNGQLYVLTNNHVIVRDNRYSVNIYQPSPIDGGRSNNNLIGNTFEFVPYSTGINYMDAAIGRPYTNSLLNPRYLISSTGRLITLRGHLLSYRVGTRLYKSGRTTGYTTGVVSTINTDLVVDGRQFRNQTIIAGSPPVTSSGDSGSVWINADGYAAALSFAGPSTNEYSISTPIASVLSTFRVKVAVPAGSSGFKSGTASGFAPKGNFAFVRPFAPAQRQKITVLRAK